jgi:ABC-type transporter lipoprotein component MlaA
MICYRFLPQCNRALISINIQLGAHGLQFHRSVPRRLRDGYAAFRDAYHQRRRAPSSTFTRGSTTSSNDNTNHRTTPRQRGPT